MDSVSDVIGRRLPGSQDRVLDAADVWRHASHNFSQLVQEVRYHASRDAEPEPEPPEPTHFGRSRSRRNGLLGAGAGAGAVKNGAAPAPKKDTIVGK